MLGETLAYRFNRCLVASDMRKTTTTIITKALFPSGLFWANLGSGCPSTSSPCLVTTSCVKCKTEVHAEVYRAVLCSSCCNYSKLGENHKIGKGQRLICSPPPPPCPLLPALATKSLHVSYGGQVDAVTQKPERWGNEAHAQLEPGWRRDCSGESESDWGG